MAKVKQLFTGWASTGTPVHVAQSESGAWFWREYGFNGRGKAWSAWVELSEPPKFTTRVFNHYQDCYLDLDPEKVGTLLDWGFKTLELCTTQSKCRLPS